jgi:hypothetical protein
MDLAFAVAHAIVPLSFLTIWLASVAGWAACPECLQPAEQTRLERAAA